MRIKYIIITARLSAHAVREYVCKNYDYKNNKKLQKKKNRNFKNYLRSRKVCSRKRHPEKKRIPLDERKIKMLNIHKNKKIKNISMLTTSESYVNE